jgi:hypothetical protein
MMLQLCPDRPLSAVDVDIARYHGGRADYPLGMAIAYDESGTC